MGRNMNNTNNDDVIEIDLQELFGLFVHWMWLIAACGIVAGMIGFCFSKFVMIPRYESTTKVYILNKQDNSTLTYSDVQLGTQLTKDYAQLIKGRYVLEQVIETCGLEETYDSFSDRVNVETLTDTRIIAITVTDEEPARAQVLADEIRKVAAEHIKKVMDIQAVNVAEEANLPIEPSSPSILKWTAVGMLLGIFVCAMILVIRFLMDDTIKTSDDVEKYLELSTLAMIPIRMDAEKQKGRKKKAGQESRENVSVRHSELIAKKLDVVDLESGLEEQNGSEDPYNTDSAEDTEGKGLHHASH